MKRRDFDDILNECIERMLKGESVEACLAAHPGQAAELEPLLRTAEDTLKAAAVTPRSEFRQRAGYEFQAAIRNLRPEKRGFFRWQARWVAVVSVVIVILLAGSGTVAASANSLPDQPLYAVKLATENVRLALTTSALGKAGLYAEFADTRVDEIIKMADEGKVAQVVKATDRMNDHLIAMANLSLPVSEADIAGEETSAALMAAPPTEATDTQSVTTPSAAMVPSAVQAPAPTTVPVPAPEPVTRQPQASLSANLSLAKAPEKQEALTAQAPMTATARALKPEAAAKAGKPIKIKGPADLETAVSERATENTQKLEEVLERVPDPVKLALQRAIDIAGKGYEEALKNIGRK
jgi:hypothetical protein